MRLRALALCCIAWPACAPTAAECPPAAAPTAPPPTASAPAAQPAAPAPAPSPSATAAIKPRFVKAAATLQGVSKVKVRTTATGAVTKLAVYHDDAAQTPEVIKKMTADRFPGSKVRYYELEWYDDRGWVHEVEVKTADGKSCELSASEDGALHYIECEIAPANLPKPVAAAIQKLLPKGEIVAVETKKGPAVDVVSVEVKVDGKEHYVHFSPSGELQKHLLKIPAVLEVPAQ